MLPKSVHAWEIEGYIKIKKELRDQIREGLKKKYGSLHKAEIALGLSDYYHRKLHETFTRKDILFRLIKESNIPKNKAERDIIEWKDTVSQKSYPISFPSKISPLHIRIISHLIGDGTIGSNYTWCQKDVTPLEVLIKKLLGTNLKRRDQVVTIPRIIVKIGLAALNLNLDDLTKEKLLKKLISLPKKYRIQTLTAIIEDEGTCDINRITIRMMNKEIMVLIIELIDSLNYSRSNLTTQYYKRYDIKNEVWRASMNIKGIKKYWSDLKDIEKTQGRPLSLWKKREKTKELSTHKTNIEGWERNKKLRKGILGLGRFKKLRFDSIKRGFSLTDNETMSILRHLVNKKEIEKINKGTYKIK